MRAYQITKVDAARVRDYLLSIRQGQGSCYSASLNEMANTVKTEVLPHVDWHPGEAVLLVKGILVGICPPMRVTSGQRDFMRSLGLEVADDGYADPDWDTGHDVIPPLRVGGSEY